MRSSVLKPSYGTLLLIGALSIQSCLCMSKSHVLNLQKDAHAMFHHGYDAYMKYAFPADEIRPLSCAPLSRDNEPTNYVLNDVLGNYSLTAVDSLSALAILSHSSKHSLDQFWETVQGISELYSTTGFDQDAKVQVFETVIRGVGGLVSGHEFAIGLLPMAGTPGVGLNGWIYENQLLHLAHDLATRLLPAFTTKTGIPYPRVNLRYGCVNVRPFEDDEDPNEKCRKEDEEAEKAGFRPVEGERSDNCAAGSGSLTLEFSTLSRLLEDFKQDYPEKVDEMKNSGSGIKHQWNDVGIFERVSQAAFWAVWERRSTLNLIGAGIDAVTGMWEPQSGALSGIGASTDSFFEYALKTYILLSSSPTVPTEANPTAFPVSAWLDVYETSVEAINKHLLVESPAVYYQGVHMSTGNAMVQWVDSLSAFWPGLLVLGGDVALAEKTSLFYTALWQRHQALPERYIPTKQNVALQWWPGRPEFAESIYHLYRATKDIWYLRVGEMILRDIQRRCWGRCGWGGLQDVRSGEVSDRMESFMLSETAAYLYLLFSDDHPLHKGDTPWVFTTEGHPIRMPPSRGKRQGATEAENPDGSSRTHIPPAVCENPKLSSPTPRVGALFSRVASRSDSFHPYNAVGLNLLPDDHPRKPTKISFLNDDNIAQEFGYYNDKDEENPYRLETPYSPTNGSFYPWTLPPHIISPDAYCARLPMENKIDLLFSTVQVKPGEVPPPGWVNIRGGILINAWSGLRVGFSKELVDSKFAYFVTKIGDRYVSKKEIVVIDKFNIDNLQVDNGIKFRTEKDEGYEVIVDYETVKKDRPSTTATKKDAANNKPKLDIKIDDNEVGKDLLEKIQELLYSNFKDQFNFKEEPKPELPAKTLTPPPPTTPNSKVLVRRHLQAILSTGIGAQEAPPLVARSHTFLRTMEYTPSPTLPFRSVYAAGVGCDSPLPSIAATYNIILFKRGKCPFAQKLNNIPTSTTIKLAIVVNFDSSTPTHKEYENLLDLVDGGGVNDWRASKDEWLIRPLVDQYQVDSRNGQRRKNPVPLVFVGGGEVTYEALSAATGVGLRERWKATLDGVPVGNLVPVA